MPSRLPRALYPEQMRRSFQSGPDDYGDVVPWSGGLTLAEILEWAKGAKNIPRARVAGSGLEGGMSDLYKETSEPYRELDDWRNSQNPLSVSTVDKTRPPEQQAGGDEQALQQILSQDEYNPASGMTYQEWWEWKMANSRSLGVLGKITGARMPRTGQRR